MDTPTHTHTFPTRYALGAVLLHEGQDPVVVLNGRRKAFEVAPHVSPGLEQRRQLVPGPAELFPGLCCLGAVRLLIL